MKQPQDSVEWWIEVSNSAQKFSDWLQNQYYGEYTAAPRIREMSSKTQVEAYKFILGKIADQEEYHAQLVKDLLDVYGLMPLPVEEFGTSSYWPTVEPAQEDFSTMCAIAGHAEALRLERIRAIVDDINAPTDVYAVFCIILQNKVLHEQAFKSMAGEEALAKVKPCQLLGLEV